MLGAEEVCDLLGVPELPTAFGIEIAGATRYPLIQFEVENARVYPGAKDILASLPDHWSHLRLLGEFLQPHVDFDGPPAASSQQRSTEPEKSQPTGENPLLNQHQ